ncbi:ParB/RepB/Spo0J family partition protein [Scatolibacter rhodanostii]|uniref:ParB/RepB/Spo0J family partition protein n=1 Tax=Scatolibacter rhodanostii TaxID=2014781 RepID=UPI000C0872C2|nr:ParB/RepB/Spo0J family partition protein [Scatolibacter rhodanostii]
MFFKEKLKLVTLPVEKILPNPSQPRKYFSADELSGLAESIKENGLLQPVTVRKDEGQYYLIAGERRLRATKLAGLTEITAIISEFSQEESAVLALLENIQRQNLNIFEQANAIASLLSEWDIKQEEAARRLGMSQSYLANKLRLLRLNPKEQADILKFNLTERHARALLKITDAESRAKVLETVIERRFNVAQTEDFIESILSEKKKKKKPMRTFIAKDVRLFINTIDHAVIAMKTAGIEAQSERIETEEYIQCTVRIPKLNRLQV